MKEDSMLCNGRKKYRKLIIMYGENNILETVKIGTLRWNINAWGIIQNSILGVVLKQYPIRKDQMMAHPKGAYSDNKYTILNKLL